MKSAAKALLNMLDIHNTIRPAKAESAIVMMLYTLNRHGLLEEMLSDMRAYSPLTIHNREELTYIKNVTSSPELVGLYDNPKAIRLLLKLIPQIKIASEYSVITIDEDEVVDILNRSRRNHQQSEIKKLLLAVNRLDLGYKIFQKNIGEINKFHVIKYTTKEDIMRILQDYRLQMPSILDKVFG